MKHYVPMQLVVRHFDNDIVTASIGSTDNIGRPGWWIQD